jgi:uncharacterized OB-fold protein
VNYCDECGEPILPGQATCEVDRSEGEHYGTAIVHANCDEPDASLPEVDR